MTEVWIGGFQVPPLVVPVVIGYAVLAAVILWRGPRRRALVVPWVLFVGAMAVAAVAAATTIRRGIGVALLAVVLLLPVVAETIQWAAPSLMRACDADDLADNYMGLAIGLGAGALLVGLRWAARRESARLTP